MHKKVITRAKNIITANCNLKNQNNLYFDNIFLNAKRISENHIAVEINMDVARSQGPFPHIAIWSNSPQLRKNINVYSGEFQQNLMAYVDNFPCLVWHVENEGNPDYPNHMIMELPAEETTSIYIHIVDRMQQYNHPAEIYALDLPLLN